VGIIGFNSPEWFLANLATIFAGGLSAGIYPTNNPSACRYIMENCRANVLIVEDEKQLAKFLPFRDQLPHLRAIVQWSGQVNSQHGVISWSELMRTGAAEADDELNARLNASAVNECCHLVYTSGTTGPPKGVMLSHDNLTFTARRLAEIFHLKEGGQERLVSYLPLSHIAANICDLFVMMTCGGSVYFADKDALKGTLTVTLKEALPTLFFGVPR
jgi:long-chain-fatty-acid--CoA ligase ACSBG